MFFVLFFPCHVIAHPKNMHTHTPVPSSTWPTAVYGWGVVAESMESADLPLINDSVCSSLPVNLG